MKSHLHRLICFLSGSVIFLSPMENVTHCQSSGMEPSFPDPRVFSRPPAEFRGFAMIIMNLARVDEKDARAQLKQKTAGMLRSFVFQNDPRLTT